MSETPSKTTTPMATATPAAAQATSPAAAPVAVVAATVGSTPARRRRLTTVAAAVAVLLGVGGGALWWTQRAAATAEAAVPERGVVSFEPFVVNLADPGVSRFLRVKIQLVVGDAGQARGIDGTLVKMMQARSAILELLTTQQSDVLVTSAGKAALRSSIAEKVSQALGGVEVVDVLFSDFVVQF